MNTEQLKTPQQHIVDLTRKTYGEDFKGMNDSDTLMKVTRWKSGLFIKAMQDFASQESKRAVDEFKIELRRYLMELPAGSINMELYRKLIDKL